WSALTINIGTALLEIGVIPQKRAVGITASLGHPAKSLPSYSAWYLAGEVASVRRRVGGWQTRSEPKWPISVDYRMRKRASCPSRFRTFQRPAGRSELAGVLSLPKRRSLEMNHSELLPFPPNGRVLSLCVVPSHGEMLRRGVTDPFRMLASYELQAGL